MAYNSDLERLMFPVVSRWKEMTPRCMFGGICYLVRGNICVGIWKDFLIARVGARAAELKKRKGVTDFDVTGTPMKGWIKVDPAGWKRKESMRLFLKEAKERRLIEEIKPIGDRLRATGLRVKDSLYQRFLHFDHCYRLYASACQLTVRFHHFRW